MFGNGCTRLVELDWPIVADEGVWLRLGSILELSLDRADGLGCGTERAYLIISVIYDRNIWRVALPWFKLRYPCVNEKCCAASLPHFMGSDPCNAAMLIRGEANGSTSNQ